jgi:hypothetical protein
MHNPRVERNTDRGSLGYNRSHTQGLLCGKVASRVSRSRSCIFAALSLAMMVGLGGCGGSAGDGQPSTPGGGAPVNGPPPPPPVGPTVAPPQTPPPPQAPTTSTTTTTLPPDSDTTTSPT